MTNISIVIAVSQNGVIGNIGKIPWHIPEDLKHFKALTINKTIIMGRKTHESIGAKLPRRLNIVISRNAEYCPADPSVLVYKSLSEAIKDHAECGELFVIGGGQLCVEALPIANKIYLTKVLHDFHGDVVFPKLGAEWLLIDCRLSQDDNFCYEFQTLERQTI